MIKSMDDFYGMMCLYYDDVCFLFVVDEYNGYCVLDCFLMFFNL